MPTRRLIEDWLPISDLGEESIRERRSMTALPPNYYLHVWWARRPLVASRAAVLASLLPADSDRDLFMHAIGIHGSPSKTRKKLDAAKRTGEDLGSDVYGYRRAFLYCPMQKDVDWFTYESRRLGVVRPLVFDPTAGGGSIPFEARRFGICTFANDINPVASLILSLTLDYSFDSGNELLGIFSKLTTRFIEKARLRLARLFPDEQSGGKVDAFLWARTIRCPYCDGVVPLSPNWKLTGDGVGIKLLPVTTSKSGRHCEFAVVHSLSEHSGGTIRGGDASCPYPDCCRVIDGDEVKSQAQRGEMGEQLYCIAGRKKEFVTTKTGKTRETWLRYYRAPVEADQVDGILRERIAESIAEWEAMDWIPTEEIPQGLKTEEPRRYGMRRWSDLFSSRQLLSHVAGVAAFRELLAEELRRGGSMEKATAGAFILLSFALDKFLNYNSRMSIWMPTREVIANTFNRHDFAFCWSHAEMAPIGVGDGYSWAIEQVSKSYRELCQLAQGSHYYEEATPQTSLIPPTPQPHGIGNQTVSCLSGDNIGQLLDASVDAIVMDPPYYDNVMYAELSDYFYVWLKRTAGYVIPGLFKLPLTDKENEAVANPAKFKGVESAKELAYKDYRDRMAAIFSECRRVLRPDGILTLMFTHKATGAWDALTKGLLHAGFMITASWPVNTESEGSLHIKDKSAANSTILLVCRAKPEFCASSDIAYWEDVEPRVRAAVRKKVAEFQKAGIGGVDLYLSCFGPALEEFSANWPLKRGQPRPLPAARRAKRQGELFPEAWDPYAVDPEDALESARREVKNWRLEQLVQVKRKVELDALTEWFVLAWDAFRAPEFPFDEGLRLARVVGLDIDHDVVGHVAEKKASTLVLWDSEKRAAKGALGSPDGSKAMLDALHHAAYMARTRTLAAAKDLLERAGVIQSPLFLTALEATLEVLPPSRAFTGVALDTAVSGAGSDFEALENLRRLALREEVNEPEQLKLWQEGKGRS